MANDIRTPSTESRMWKYADYGGSRTLRGLSEASGAYPNSMVFFLLEETYPSFNEDEY